MTAWSYINVVGGAIISALTLLASVYLLVSLSRQGRGKLRVRLLLGMVISDLLVGLFAFPQEVSYLVNHPLTKGRACNAMGFLFTAILFSQHLWTLSIAIATFLLLKYPLSRTTTLLERYSWLCAPTIWAISFTHSGLWWATVGWKPSNAICYYGSHIVNSSALDARDLMQFIPRASVFLIVVGLYSRLFSFLRRPDTLQLSSQFVSGTRGGSDEPRAGRTRMKPFHWLQRTSVPGANGGAAGSGADTAPWEQLEFVQIGGRRNIWSPTQTQQSFVPYPIASSIGEHKAKTDDGSTPVDEHADPFVKGLQREASGSTAVGETAGSLQPSEDETLAPPEPVYTCASAPAEHHKLPPTPALSPVFSEDSVGVARLADGNKLDLGVVDEGGDKLDLGTDDEGGEDGKGDEEAAAGQPGRRARRPSGQTLKEFFQENQVDPRDPRGSVTNGNGTGGMQISATAYFNRQASLLMLYFPLAYLVVFSISLVRLVYAMVNHQPSKLLALLSSWMVLSVGLIDGLVYGFAEYMVRRRVRRKLPEQFI